MIKKIEHIGIAVKSLENSNHLFKKLFGHEHYKIEKVESGETEETGNRKCVAEISGAGRISHRIFPPSFASNKCRAFAPGLLVSVEGYPQNIYFPEQVF